jgi:hypothetical protein
MDPLLSSDSVNSGLCYVTPATYTYAVTSHDSGRGVASSVLCGSAPRLYDWTKFNSVSECSAGEGSVVECYPAGNRS